MHRIEIKNFGPIKKVEMDITKMCFLLGELASGKSTIAKLVYFFRSAQDEFVTITANSFDAWLSCYRAYLSLLNSKFTNIFGATMKLGTSEITYYYSPDSQMKITPSVDNKVNINISKTMMEHLKEIWTNSKPDTPNSKINGLETVTRRGVYNVFHDEYYSLYIPAGRALLSRQMLLRVILSREANLINGQVLDYRPFDVVDAPTRKYMVEVEDARIWFATPKTYGEKDRFLISTSEKILKGTYSLNNDYDYIKLQNQQLVPLSYSSSGQQEVIWLLNILHYYAFMGRKCFVVIEEPEAHLHPDAQYLLVQYVAAFSNITGSEVLITTHSPYILTSCNNLFFAEKCARGITDDGAVSSIIAKDCWVNADDASAYIMENASVKDIMDKKLAMVEIAELDKVASEQDDEYEALVRLLRGGATE